MTVGIGFSRAGGGMPQRADRALREGDGTPLIVAWLETDDKRPMRLVQRGSRRRRPGALGATDLGRLVAPVRHVRATSW